MSSAIALGKGNERLRNLCLFPTSHCDSQVGEYISLKRTLLVYTAPSRCSVPRSSTLHQRPTKNITYSHRANSRLSDIFALPLLNYSGDYEKKLIGLDNLHQLLSGQHHRSRHLRLLLSLSTYRNFIWLTSAPTESPKHHNQIFLRVICLHQNKIAVV
ncbi:hypothetical protein T440DRAFT_189657 [Plenodomus tracheiphilus IPT5]|uniref:Uncharacterized protein n=1 Tax=Plenodomus tracheiphilus IPT5 TaxID=1408161 RepID=A0A6A7AXS2_9PLEO|nr:hypothetical protein T440DRAFT_189657 [Plenodomus tracheiphilus IPT5]